MASDGFILNYISTLLILCKPFVGNFNKYGNFLNKINCFYLVDNSNIENAKISMEKLEHGAEDEFEVMFKSDADISEGLSGVTVNPVV